MAVVIFVSASGLHKQCNPHVVDDKHWFAYQLCCQPHAHLLQSATYCMIRMLPLTDLAVSCIDLVVSRLQAASAAVAVAKVLWVCLCFMILCWAFPLPTSLSRYWGLETQTPPQSSEIHTNQHGPWTSCFVVLLSQSE